MLAGARGSAWFCQIGEFTEETRRALCIIRVMRCNRSSPPNRFFLFVCSQRGKNKNKNVLSFFFRNAEGLESWPYLCWPERAEPFNLPVRLGLHSKVVQVKPIVNQKHIRVSSQMDARCEASTVIPCLLSLRFVLSHIRPGRVACDCFD